MPSLISDPITPIELLATRYPQGRNEKALFGSPYFVVVGFPLNINVRNTCADVTDQKLFLSLFDDRKITLQHIVSQSNFLWQMISTGYKMPLLAWNDGHLILLLAKNSRSEVINFIVTLEYIDTIV